MLERSLEGVWVLSGPQRRRDLEGEHWGHEQVPKGRVGWTGQCWREREKEVAIQGECTHEKHLK